MIFASLKWLKTIVLNVLCFVLHLLLHFFCFVLGFLWTFSNLSPKFLWSQNRRCTCRVFERSKPLTFLFLINPPLSTMQCQWHFCPRPAAVFVLSLLTCWKQTEARKWERERHEKARREATSLSQRQSSTQYIHESCLLCKSLWSCWSLTNSAFPSSVDWSFSSRPFRVWLQSPEKIRRSFNLSATLWYKRSYRPDFQEPPKDHMKILHGAFTRFFISSCMLASSSRACQLPQLDEVSKLRKNFKASRFVSSLACCLSAWKSLPVSDPLQSGAKILHFRPPSRVQSAAPAPEMHNVTHWKNRTVYFQLWQLLRVQRKNSSAKKKECHLISASMSSGSFCETLTPPCSDLCILFRKFHVVDAALHWG